MNSAKPKRSRVTINDVAKEVGLSASTAADAFTRPSKLSEDTVQRILAAGKKLGYERRTYAKQTRQPVYCYLMPHSGEEHDGTAEWWAKELMSLQQAAFRTGGQVVGIASELDREDSEIAAFESMWALRQVKGFILSDGRLKGTDRRHDWLLENKVPFVQHGRGSSGSPYNWLDLHDEEATKRLTEQLILKGHRYIAFLGRNDTNPDGPDIHRLQGYQVAMEVARLDDRQRQLFVPANGEVVKFGDFATQVEGLVADQIDGEGPSAIVCGSDAIALGVQKALFKSARSDEPVLTGIDDAAARRTSVVPFASAGIDWSKWGNKMIGLMQQAIAYPGTHYDDLLNHDLVDLEAIEIRHSGA